MAHRITNPELGDTEKLLGQILPLIFEDERVSILVPAGDAFHVLARIRTMMSRRRKILKAQGKNIKMFKLRSSIHPETHDGKRCECLILWKSIGELHLLREKLDDILAEENTVG